MRLLNNQAAASATGLESLVGRQGISPEHKTDFELQQASGKLEPVETSKRFTEALQTLMQDNRFKNEDGTPNWKAIKQQGGAMMSDVIDQAERFNQNMNFMVNGIRQGHFNDQNGNELRFGINDISEADYREVNIADGMTTEEYTRLRTFAETQTMQRDITLKTSNLGIRGQELAEKQEQQEQGKRMHETGQP